MVDCGHASAKQKFDLNELQYDVHVTVAISSAPPDSRLDMISMIIL